MKRLLLISYYFPPEGGAGTQRCAKFAKYLPQFGWQPTVLTRAASRQTDDYHTEDHSLLADVDGQAMIVRAPAAGEPRSWARALPDIDAGRNWLEPAFNAAGELFGVHNDISAVVVSMSPFDLSELGLRIQREFRAPVIFDLRDPWAMDGWRLRGNYLRWRRDLAVMKRVLPQADGVIANTAEARKTFLERIPKLDGQRVVTIPNGFDEEDFAGVEGMKPGPGNGRPMTICHLGTLHCSELYRYEGALGWLKKIKHYRPESIDVSGRTPLHLLRALRMLRERGELGPNEVRVQLKGSDDSETRRCVSDSGIADQVDVSGYLSHDKAIESLMQADVLFAPLHGMIGEGRSLIVPGKIYEYLRTGRPMLGCLPPGDARDLVERAGWPCVNPCDPWQIAQAIVDLHRSWKRGELAVSSRAEWLRQYERRALTGRLAQFVDQITGGKCSNAMPVIEPQEMSAVHG